MNEKICLNHCCGYKSVKRNFFIDNLHDIKFRKESKIELSRSNILRLSVSDGCKLTCFYYILLYNIFEQNMVRTTLEMGLAGKFMISGNFVEMYF